jgi:enoyl reductase
VRKTRLVTTAGALAATCVLALSPSAYAKDPGGSQFDVEGTNEQDGGRTLESRIVFSGATAGGGKDTSGGFTAADDWTPPACWYEPKWTPAEFADEFRKRWDIPHASGVGEAYRLSQDHYVNGKPYKDFNKEETGKGIWWESVRDEGRAEAGDPAAFACDARTFWVENGEIPEVENAITPEVLAELAYARIKVPDTSVDLAPKTATKVNLPTWAWLDKADFHEVSVTASLAVGGVDIQATTTAKPVSLKLEPGTPDAETYPASGECVINDDGSIGEPYAQGKADQDPPCGIKYLRSSGDGSFELRATVTWEVAWAGTGGAGGDLPDGTFGNEQTVIVQEIQAVNR